MRNEYEIIGDVVVIRLKRRTGPPLFTKVSKAQLGKLQSLDATWSPQDHKVNTIYVMTTIKVEGKVQRIRLHRFLTDAPEGLVVNHINGDGLDNTDENLEVVSKQVNSIKRVFLNSNNKSGIRCVSYLTKRKKWEVKFRKKCKTYHFGRFSTKEDAISASLAAYTDLFGEELKEAK